MVNGGELRKRWPSTIVLDLFRQILRALFGCAASGTGQPYNRRSLSLALSLSVSARIYSSKYLPTTFQLAFSIFGSTRWRILFSFCAADLFFCCYRRRETLSCLPVWTQGFFSGAQIRVRGVCAPGHGFTNSSPSPGPNLASFNTTFYASRHSDVKRLMWRGARNRELVPVGSGATCRRCLRFINRSCVLASLEQHEETRIETNAQKGSLEWIEFHHVFFLCFLYVPVCACVIVCTYCFSFSSGSWPPVASVTVWLRFWAFQMCA